MGLIVNGHELLDAGLGVALGGGKRNVPEKFLDGAQVGTVAEQVRGEGVAQGMGMQVPIDFSQLAIFGDDVTHAAVGETATAPIYEDRFAVRQVGGFKDFGTNRPV